MILVRPTALRLALLFATLAAGTVAAAAPNPENEKEEFKTRLAAIGRVLSAQGATAAREEAEGLVEFVTKSQTLPADSLAAAHERLALCCSLCQDYEAAEDHLSHAFREWEEAYLRVKREVDGGRTEYGGLLALFALGRASNVEDSATLCVRRGQSAEAESRFLSSLEMLHGVPDSAGRRVQTTSVLQKLGELYRTLGRYADAEARVGQALQIAPTVLPADSLRLADCYYILGEICRCQGRLSETERLFGEALAICSKRRDTPASFGYLAKCYNGLALVCFDRWHEQDRGRDADDWKKADENYRKALDALTEAGLANHPNRAQTLSNQGRLYRDHGCFHPATRDRWFPKAETSYQEACKILREHPASSPTALVHALNNLALLYYDWELYAAAREPLDDALKILDQNPLVPLESRYNTYYTRAKVAWANNRRDRALRDLEVAMQLSVSQRALGSGTPYDRAKYFTQLANPFERMVRWQRELAGEDPDHAQDHVQRAYRAMERGRALSLLDQMELQGLDLLADVPEPEANQLRRRQTEARAEIARLESELARAGLSSADKKKLQSDLEEQRAEYQDVQRRIWDVSPACRRAAGNPRQPVPLDELQQWATENEAIILEYMLGVEGGYVLVVPSQGRQPWIERLVLDDRQAAALGVEQGPLTAERVRKALMNPERTGVLDRLRSRKAEPPVSGLSALWQTLVPEGVRAALLDSTRKRAVVVPDGPLALLPFETLVVDPYTGPEYLLDRDDAPPIVYAPSAALLVNLARRAPRPPSPGVKPVLSVAKADYRDHRTRKPVEITQGRPLEDLANAVSESDRVRDTLGEDGVERLIDDDATEANVRRNAPGRRILHMACHSWAQQEYGNMFGAAALTIGPRGENDPADDGYLTLSETYDLDLRACELVIVSGCYSASGPAQRGEAVWAISRGYLVAGAQRVVASAWSLNDRAAVSLVGAFCQFAEENRRAGQPDHAEALHRAKRWLRSDSSKQGWSHPYYWAPLMLMGPH